MTFAFSDLDFGGFPAREVVFNAKSGDYVDGKWQSTGIVPVTLRPRIQNAQPKEFDNLEIGGRRVVDAKILRFGHNLGFKLGDKWTFDGYEWETAKIDSRPERRFCRIIVGRLDT